MKPSLTLYVFGAALAVIWFAAPSQAQQSSVGQTSPQVADPHGWLGTETVKTRFGDFEFKNGYPTPAAADALLDQLKFNRADRGLLTRSRRRDLRSSISVSGILEPNGPTRL